jgi:superfamily I DNA/RNA helicase
MAQAVRTEEDTVKAEKALEVSRVYAHYEGLLRQKGVVDFSDLINRPIKILQTHPDVLADYRAQFQHVLVDEYQDVNRASAILLKLLAGEGQHLWVVHR